MKRIVFTIGENGSVKADSSGFHGDVCVRDTAKALAGLDAKLETQTKKAEYVEKVQIKQQNVDCDT